MLRLTCATAMAQDLGNNLTVKTHKRPGETFITAMMQYVHASALAGRPQRPLPQLMRTSA